MAFQERDLLVGVEGHPPIKTRLELTPRGGIEAVEGSSYDVDAEEKPGHHPIGRQTFQGSPQMLLDPGD